jgi:hypothetical protein
VGKVQDKGLRKHVPGEAHKGGQPFFLFPEKASAPRGQYRLPRTVGDRSHPLTFVVLDKKTDFSALGGIDGVWQLYPHRLVLGSVAGHLLQGYHLSQKDFPAFKS